MPSERQLRAQCEAAFKQMQGGKWWRPSIAKEPQRKQKDHAASEQKHGWQVLAKVCSPIDLIASSISGTTKALPTRRSNGPCNSVRVSTRGSPVVPGTRPRKWIEAESPSKGGGSAGSPPLPFGASTTTDLETHASPVPASSPWLSIMCAHAPVGALKLQHFLVELEQARASLPVPTNSQSSFGCPQITTAAIQAATVC
jgi:hypothetical protein